MSKPQSTTQLGPNLWHFSALVWGTSLLLLSLFAMPISVGPLGIRLQLCLTSAHLAGVFYMWRLARHGNPERLMDIAIVTLVFIYIVPLCMLATPVIVLAAYAMHTDASLQSSPHVPQPSRWCASGAPPPTRIPATVSKYAWPSN
jgi:hypothetical protein